MIISFITCVPLQILCNPIYDEIGRDCGTHGREYKGVQGFAGELKGRGLVAGQGMGG
jgi:hypothetical protein